MNQCIIYLLQENKLVPLSGVSGCEHHSCRHLPAHSGYPRLVLPLHPAEGIGCCQESFCLCIRRMGSGRWAPKDHVLSRGSWRLNLLHPTACQYLSLVVFRGAVQAFVRAVCLNLGLWPESINPVNVQE